MHMVQGRDPLTLFRENGKESPKDGFDRWKEVFKWSRERRGCGRNRPREQNVERHRGREGMKCLGEMEVLQYG